MDEMPVWAKYGAEIPMYPENVDSTDDMDFEKNIRIVFDESFKGIKNHNLNSILGF